MASVAWSLDENGDTHLAGSGFAIVRDAAYVRQAIETKLRFHRGEWYLNLKFGVPWLPRDGGEFSILGSNADLGRAAGEVQAVILSVEGVQFIDKYNNTFEGSTRKLTVTFDAVTIFGTTGLTEVVM